MENLIKTRLNLRTLLVAASFLSLGSVAVGGTALAQEPRAASTTSVAYYVGYSDLDVSTSKGAKTLYLRIRYGAETLCQSAATWGKQDGEACVNKAVNAAVARIDAPLLTQYTQLRSKRAKAGVVQLANAK